MFGFYPTNRKSSSVRKYSASTGASKYLEKKFGENFTVELDASDEFARYASENYSFELNSSFIQAITEEDLNTPISTRLDEVVGEMTIEKNTRYRFAAEFVGKPELFEYKIEPL